MRTLFALLIGIDNYPNPRHQLEGCVGDVRAFRQYLQQYADGAGYRLNPLELLDEAATRSATIKGFDHFQQAGTDDICLFFYSGHGSRNDAHEAFWHLEPSKLNQSLVLWDSRSEGGRDLLDKELSYLIWKAAKDKPTPLIAIMDSCHSGSGTRMAGEGRVRMAEKGKDLRNPEELEGYHAFEKGRDGALSPPRGKHILLAASRDNQEAKEDAFEGEPRGAFTFSLIEALRQYGNQLTYAELANHLRIRMAQRVKAQSPQLESIAGADPNLLFLSNAKTSGQPAYLVSYETAKGWHINAGAIDGFRGGGASQTQLKLEPGGHPIRIKEVHPGYSTVEGMPAGVAPETVHRAVVTSWGSGGLKLAFAPGCDPDAERMLRDLFQRSFADGMLQLTDDPGKARYHILAADQSLQLLLPGEKRPVFRRIPGYSAQSGTEFVKRLGTVGKWIQLLEMANPQTTLGEDEFKIELFRLSQAGKLADADPVEALDWRKPASLRYFYENGKWTKPAMQLRITNTGTRNLWVSLLFLTNNFGAYNIFLPKQELAPGQQVWMLDVTGGIPRRSVLLQVEPEYHSWGVNQIDDFLKVVVCTEEFSTDRWNQAGLPLDDRTSGTRSFALWEDLSQSDWLTREIELHIIRPFEPKEIQGLSAKTMLNTLQEATAAFPAPYVLMMENGKELRPVDLSPAQQADRPLCVLEYWDSRPAAPVRLEAPAGAIPCHCDPATGRFRALQHEWKDGALYLTEFPPASPSVYGGLGETCKVFFMQ